MNNEVDDQTRECILVGIAVNDGLAAAIAQSAGPSGYRYVGTAEGVYVGFVGAAVGDHVGSDGVIVGTGDGHIDTGQCVPSVFVALITSPQLSYSCNNDPFTSPPVRNSAVIELGTVPVR